MESASAFRHIAHNGETSYTELRRPQPAFRHKALILRDMVVLAVRSELCSEWLFSLLTANLQGIFSFLPKNNDY